MKKFYIFSVVLLVVSVLFFGCSNSKDDFLTTQNTSFKITDKDTGVVITIASMDIEGVKVTKGEGVFSAPLVVNNDYNINVVADGYKPLDFNYKAIKKSSFTEINMERFLIDVEGNIISDGDNPLEGVEVKIIDLDKHVISDSNGCFYLDNVPANVGEDDMYTFSFSKPHYKIITYETHICEKDSVIKNVPSSYVMADSSDTVERMVFSLSDIDLGNINSDVLSGNVEGRVTDDKGSAIENVLVSILNTGQSYITDNDGLYSFNGIPIGNYDLKFTHNDFFPNNDSIQVITNEITTLNIVLNRLNSSSVSGITVPSSTIILKNKDNEYNTTANIDGSFQLVNVVAGNYDIIVNHVDYSSATKNIYVNTKENTNIGTINLSPLSDGYIDISVVDHDGNNLFNNDKISFELLNDVGEIFLNESSYYLSDLPIGEYKIKISYSDDVFYQSFSDVITAIIEPEHNDSNILNVVFEIPFIPVLQYIEGRVIYDDIFIQDVNVRLLEEGLSTTTDSNGFFRFNNLNIGVYTLELSHSSFNPVNVSVDLSLGKPFINDFFLNVKSGSFSGITTIDNVDIIISNDVFSYTTTSDDSGYFSITGVSPGLYSATFNKSNYVSKTFNISVNAGVNTNIGNVSLNGLPGTITGFLVDKYDVDKTINNVVISGSGKTVYSNDNGSFSIDNVPVGIHTLTFVVDDYADKTMFDVVVNANETVNLGNIALEPLASGIGSLIINIQDESGNPLVADYIGLNPASITYYNENTVTYNDLDVNSYTISVSKEGYYTETQSVTILSDKTVTTTITLKALPSDRYGFIEGFLYHKDAYTNYQGDIIIDPNGYGNKPIANATIIIGDNTAITDENGYFKINSRAGSYDVINIRRTIKYNSDYEFYYNFSLTSNPGDVLAYDLFDYSFYVENNSTTYLDIVLLERIKQSYSYNTSSSSVSSSFIFSTDFKVDLVTGSDTTQVYDMNGTRIKNVNSHEAYIDPSEYVGRVYVWRELSGDSTVTGTISATIY